MEWHPRIIKLKSNEKLKFEKTNKHPLQLNKELHIKINKEKLNQKQLKPKIKSNFNGFDPLSAALNETITTDNLINQDKLIINKRNSYLGDDFNNFQHLQTSIINKSIALVKSIKKRAILADFTPSSLNFIQNLNNLKTDLHESWQTNSRVKALRTVSLCAKNLGELDRFDLYSYKFILTIQILDEFNELVYKRIEDKIKESTDIEIARETCKNWSFKICSIQELLPRLYLEIATLNTFHKFFIYDKNDKLLKTIQRLTECVRGIGDPFIAIYCYVYLSKTILNIIPENKELFFAIYTDFLNRIDQIKEIESNLPEFLLKFSHSKSAEICTYLNYTQFYLLPLEWLIKCLLYKSNYELSERVYKELNIKLSNHQSSDLFFIIFNLLLSQMNSNFVIENHKFIIELIKLIYQQNLNKNLPKYQLSINLCTQFLNDDLLTSKLTMDTKQQLFKEIWKLNKQLNEREYIIVTNLWIDFSIKHFEIEQISSILNNIIKNVISKKEFLNCNEDLITILIKILNSNIVDFQKFLTSDIFVPFIEMFQKESTKVLACKTVIKQLIKNVKNGDDSLNFSDSDYMSILIYLTKTIHDSIDQLTSDEEHKELSNLINEFINLVQFNNYNDNLDFLVQCRSNFANFNSVIIQLVFNANKLSFDYSNDNQNNELELRSSFLKACLAYSCITIPSIDSEIIRAQLYLHTAQIAICCGFVEQTEFFIRNAISTIDQLNYDKQTKSTELFFIGYIKSLLSFLIVVPDDLNKGYLYLFKKLYKTIIEIKFKQNDYKISIYLNMLNYLTTISQPVYPYHLDNIESNDTALLNDKEFEKTINKIGSLIIEKILEYLEELGVSKEYSRQSALAFDCFYFLLNNGQTDKQFKLLFNIWQLAIKNNLSDSKKIQTSIDYTREQSINLNDYYLDNLADKFRDYYLKKKLSS